MPELMNCDAEGRLASLTHVPTVNARDKIAYNTGEAAGFLGTSKRRVRRLTAQGLLASFSMDGQRLIRTDILRAARV